MDWLFDLVTNPFLIAATTSWFFAQVLKAVIYAVINKKINLERLIGDGGMPSGHSATVTSLAAMSALLCGLGSFEFAVATILAIVVCHDAMGVRRETGRQAVVINEMLHSLEELANRELSEVTLKEFVGHTPLQVIAGILIGILNSVAMYFLFFQNWAG